MANNFIQSIINPIKLVPASLAVIPQYVTKFIDDVQYIETIREYQENIPFFQPWLQVDALRGYYISNYGPVEVTLINCEGVELEGQSLANGPQDVDRPGYYVRLMDLDLNIYPAGRYLPKFKVGSTPDVWFGEPIEILASSVNTWLIEYRNYKAKNGIIFFKNDGTKLFSPTFRVPAVLKYIRPTSIDTLYFDRKHNAKFLEAVDFDLFRFIVGNSDGVPPWYMRKLGKIWTCDEVLLNGRQFAKAAENEDWNELEQDQEYPLGGWSLDVVEARPSGVIEYENTNPQVGINSMMAVVETKGFGLEDVGGDFQEIIITQ